MGSLKVRLLTLMLAPKTMLPCWLDAVGGENHVGGCAGHQPGGGVERAG